MEFLSEEKVLSKTFYLMFHKDGNRAYFETKYSHKNLDYVMH